MRVEDLRMYLPVKRGLVRAVDGVNLEVREQETIGLVGESGCGKTMTALTVMKLLPPLARIMGGHIRFKGKDLTQLTEKEMRRLRGKEISIVFQDPVSFLNPVMKIGDQVAESMMLHLGLCKKEALHRTAETFEQIGMPDSDRVTSYYPHQLSGGMRQRVLIAIAISCNASFIIMDEPTSNLDVTVQRQILDLIKNVKKELKSSLMLISHDLGIVAEICDRIYVMYAGKIMEEANTFQLFDEPKHPYTQGLIGIVSSIENLSGKLETIEGTVPDLISPLPGCRFHPRCSHVLDICKTHDPPLIDFGDNGKVSCWLYDKGDKLWLHSSK